MVLVRQLLIRLKTNLVYKLLIGFTIIYTFYITNNLIYHTHYKEGNVTLTGYITNIIYKEDKIDLTIKAKESINVSYYTDEKLDLKLGDYIEVKGKLTKPYNNTIFNLFNYRKYLLSNKIFFILNAEEIVKIKDNSNIFYKIKNIIYERMNKIKTKGYVKAFVLGDRQDLSDDIETIYQENGITHLLAVSGSHTTFLAVILLFFLKKFKYSHIIISLILVFYAFLTNFTPSILRAVFIFMLNKYDKKRTIVLIGCLMLLYNPYYIYNAGFLFSFVICFYLIYFGHLSNHFKNYFVKLFITSLICFIASIPIMINNFYYINLVSPLINLIFVPFVTFIIFPLCLIVLILPIFDNLLLFFLNIMEQLSIIFNSFNINITMCKINAFIFIIYYIVITFIFIKPKYFYVLIIMILIHTNIKYFNHKNYLTMIDVGQGDSILFEIGSKNVLIDTGGNNFSDYNMAKGKLIPYFKSLGIKKIDYLILTHGDYDHLGEGINLINEFKISNVIFNSGKVNDLEKELILKLQSKKIPYQFISQGALKIGNVNFNFINDKDLSDENEDSLIIYTKINNKNILLMGDSGKTSENYIISEYNLPKMDILKVGHHGSKNSSSSGFINEINPKIALISAGVRNLYNHPNQEVIDILNDNNVHTYVTSIDGSIKINLDTFKIYTCSNVYANGC